ncbi:AraC family transcriptional regulator [Sphaerotilus mobilis]|uniref:AraC-like protein n=1 Tax=Sphaerotilus mobilis TaxID=47994 RepID=A0A4Q7LAK1_9BURK|nr:AraC family transcriptional regulator [Sphaerotilus mobilis]RZS46650.1 hypothetical protein EV685_4067 [Sphaerotilus mobilis]
MTTFAEFESAERAAGADAVIERQWAPLTVLDTHTHPFAARALVVQGELWLAVDRDGQHGAERRLGPGDRFELARDVPHRERYGPEGATYWVARKA